MVSIQHLVGPAAISTVSSSASSSAASDGFLPLSFQDPHCLSLLTYNVLLPNSVDGWWHYKMYLPPLDDEEKLNWSTWEYRRGLLKERIARVDADVVCLQEVAPASFEADFQFMWDELGYDGREMFKKGRFRPATFWKTSRLELVSSPVHKDRTLLTAFRRAGSIPTNGADASLVQKKKSSDTKDDAASPSRIWYVLNCHLQAGREGKRRVRQMHEAVRSALTLARKLKGTPAPSQGVDESD
jgi:mRNA deadenylase 3'-5' endonuclease subunit Ccr4